MKNYRFLFFSVEIHDSVWPAGCCRCSESGGFVGTSASFPLLHDGSASPREGLPPLPGLRGPEETGSSGRPPSPGSHSKREQLRRYRTILEMKIVLLLYVQVIISKTWPTLFISPACFAVGAAPEPGCHWRCCSGLLAAAWSLEREEESPVWSGGAFLSCSSAERPAWYQIHELPATEQNNQRSHHWGWVVWTTVHP